MEAGQIHGETVKSAIALKIRSAFAVTGGTPPVTSYPTIYKEQVVQGMTKPCFFVWTMEVTPLKRMNNRYEFTHQMNVRYEPAETNETPYETCMSVALALTEALDTINVPIAVDGAEVTKQVRGKELSFSITDNVLQFFVSYTLQGYIPAAEAPTYMEQITINS